MVEDILNECKERMNKSIRRLGNELSSIRTGRANPSLLDQIKIELYSQQMPISGLASVNATDARTLLVTVWDEDNVKAVDSAIRTSSLGLNPRMDGNKLYITLPELTAERRQELIKVAKKKGEDIKISIRNVRRDINESLKKLEKDKEISEDALKDNLEKTQSLTDESIEHVEQMLLLKQSDLEKI